MSDEEVWSLQHIVERTCDMLLKTAASSSGRGLIGDMPKAGTLYRLRDGIYWWATRFNKNFSSIYIEWHNNTNAAIKMGALKYGFETQR